jgi:hypothetical protein
MRRCRPVLVLAALPCVLLLLCMPLSAQQVYKWKDANGVTQYGATPPAKGSYETRELGNRQAATPAAEAAVQPPAEDPACATARSNLALLGAKSPLQVDSDGDGKADKTLTEEDRANQRALMEATIKVKCAAAPAAGQQDEPEEQ